MVGRGRGAPPLASSLPERPPRRPAVEALRWLLLGMVVVAFALALRGRWGEVADEIGALRPAVLAAALGLVTAATAASFLAWRVVLADLGSAPARRPAARLFFLSQLGKYVPGAVWPLVAQLDLGRRLGVPRQRLAVAYVVTLGLSVAWGLLVGLAALPTVLAAESAAYALPLLALPVVGVFLAPRPLNAVLARLLRLARRPPLEHPLTGGGVLRASGAVLLFWLLAGLSVWILLLDLGAPAGETLPLALGGFGLAFSAGPLLVVLPAGAGVREAVLAVVLSGAVSAPQAVAVALVSRLLFAVSDALLATGAAAGAGRPAASTS